MQLPVVRQDINRMSFLLIPFHLTPFLFPTLSHYALLPSIYHFFDPSSLLTYTFADPLPKQDRPFLREAASVATGRLLP